MASFDLGDDDMGADLGDEMSAADRDYWDMQDSSICDDYEDSSVGVEYKGRGFF